MTYSINIGDNVVRNTTNTTPYNITHRIKGWKDSVRDVGGFWKASGQYWDGKPELRQDAEAFFDTRLGWHIVRLDEAGSVQWEGYIAAIELTVDGITKRRSISDIANRLRCAYTRYTGNVLTNGSGEMGTDPGTHWHTATGIQAFYTSGSLNPDLWFDTTWYTHGTRSIKVDTTALESMDGGGARFTGTAVVVADGRYCVRGDVYTNNLGASDTIRVTVNDGSNEIYGKIIATANGTYNFARVFDAPSTAAGTLNTQVFCMGNATIFKVDNVQLYQAGTQASTAWAENAASQAEWGVHEASVVCKPMTDTEATQRRDILLANWAHPRTKIVGPATGSDGLTITCEGYIFKTAAQSVSLGGIKSCRTHIIDLIGTSPFISVGRVVANATECYIDETQPTYLWTALQDVVEVGGASNAAYIGGCYANRKFWYQYRPTTATVKFKGGRWLTMSNQPLDPQTVRPCIVFFEDVPQGGAGLSANLLDNPRYAWVAEWEFDGDTNTVTPLEVMEER